MVSAQQLLANHNTSGETHPQIVKLWEIADELFPSPYDGDGGIESELTGYQQLRFVLTASDVLIQTTACPEEVALFASDQIEDFAVAYGVRCAIELRAKQERDWGLIDG